jgi:predicted RNase H-like nuclease (RuvC/YqgF family)
MSELETRLRWACDGRGWPTTTMCREAAERIRDLEAVNARLRSDNEALRQERTQAGEDYSTELERLRKEIHEAEHVIARLASEPADLGDDDLHGREHWR